jgi:hypothetical protein
MGSGDRLEERSKVENGSDPRALAKGQEAFASGKRITQRIRWHEEHQ